jgi:hypothetical protein
LQLRAFALLLQAEVLGLLKLSLSISELPVQLMD